MTNDATIRKISRSAVLLGLTLGQLLPVASTASAGGLEWPGLGTRGAGRAGAWRAHSDTPLALQVNPANLARLAGTQAEIALHLGTSNVCIDRSGTPTQDGNGDPRVPITPHPNDTDFGTQAEYGDVEYPRLCNNRGLFPLPQLALSFRPHRRVGIALGREQLHREVGGFHAACRIQARANLIADRIGIEAGGHNVGGAHEGANAGARRLAQQSLRPLQPTSAVSLTRRLSLSYVSLRELRRITGSTRSFWRAARSVTASSSTPTTRA